MNAAPDDAMLTIGSFARATRLSVKALRLYEERQLLQPEDVNDDTGYRYYHPDQLERARLIARLRELDMPLDVVAAVVSAKDDAETDRQIAFWWAGVEHDLVVRRGLVQSLRDDIAPVSELGRGAVPGNWQIAERPVPEQFLATVQGNVGVAELPGFIGDSIARLSALTLAVQGDTANRPISVVYLGRVNEDSDGPVEVCMTLDPDNHPSVLPVGVGLRREPGHRELFVTLTKRQVVYPDILVAYELLDTSAQKSRCTVTGPPREHYFTDFNGAGPDDEVCHAALPIR